MSDLSKKIEPLLGFLHSDDETHLIDAFRMIAESIDRIEERLDAIEHYVRTRATFGDPR